MGPRNFREYKVWQDAVEYASLVYNVTEKMPWFEKKGLCDQLQRKYSVTRALPTSHFMSTFVGVRTLLGRG